MTDKYAVIGNPIGHTKSPLIHLAFARQTGQDIDYTAIEGRIGGFRDDVDAFRQAGGRGINITAPLKLEAFKYATELSGPARLAGAVNALKFEGDRIHAQNFDGIGLVRDIVQNLGYPMAGRRVLLLGAGGAARGALLPFLEQKPARLLLVNRTVAKAQSLVGQFKPYAGGEFSCCSYPELGDIHEKFDIVVNATSASLRGELPPVHTGVFAFRCLAYELAYGKGLTPFLKLAQGVGAERLADGVGLLVEQAAEAFAWWRGVRPETAPMIKTLTVPFL
ncbi:shikimate dehydrogenase (NADP(+)) [Betaproteobacteria bacterium]|nr:shikimate dehydrogenase (NADP(+)) [Betaproteobacteria bacterium]